MFLCLTWIIGSIANDACYRRSHLKGRSTSPRKKTHLEKEMYVQ